MKDNFQPEKLHIVEEQPQSKFLEQLDQLERCVDETANAKYDWTSEKFDELRESGAKLNSIMKKEGIEYREMRRLFDLAHKKKSVSNANVQEYILSSVHDMLNVLEEEKINRKKQEEDFQVNVSKERILRQEMDVLPNTHLFLENKYISQSTLAIMIKIASYLDDNNLMDRCLKLGKDRGIEINEELKKAA